MPERNATGGRWGLVRAASTILLARLATGVATAQATETPSGDGGGGSGSGSGSASAGAGGPRISPDTIADALVDALKQLLQTLVAPIRDFIGETVGGLVRLLVATPHPTTVFGTPVSALWIDLYRYYWKGIVPLALALWGGAVGLVILLEATSHLFSGYHRSRVKRRALAGLLGILSWWWIAALSLQLVDGITRALTPTLARVSLFQVLSFGGVGLLGVVLSLLVDLFLVGILGLLYLGRQLALYTYVLVMPLVIVAWIPGVGPLRLVSRFASGVARFYVPFLVMPIPIAALFRLGGVLGESVTLSLGGLGRWLLAIVIPVIAAITPLVLLWQTGSVGYVAERVSRRLSADRAHRRGQRLRAAGARSAAAGRRAVGGVRTDPTPAGTDHGHADAPALSGYRRARLPSRRGTTGLAGPPALPEPTYERYEPAPRTDEAGAESEGSRAS